MIKGVRNIFWSLARRALPQLAIAVFELAFDPQSTRAATESDDPANAAAEYHLAFDQLAQLPESDRLRLDRDEPLPEEEEAGPFLKRLEPALLHLHAATAREHCDWKIDLARQGAAATLSHLAPSRGLARAAILRARRHWDAGRRDEAIADAQAILRLARRVGDDGRSGLVGLTQRYRMEQALVNQLCEWLTDETAAKSLEARFTTALQLEENLPKVGLLVERDHLLPWLRKLVSEKDLTSEEQKWRAQYCGELLKQHGAEWIVKRIDESETHYKEAADLLELPPEEFSRQFGELCQRLDGAGNPISQTGIVECPGIPEARQESRRLRAEWTLLEVASHILQQGPQALKSSQDPFGKGPFAYSRTTDGFRLGSALTIDGDRVELTFHTNGATAPNGE